MDDWYKRNAPEFDVNNFEDLSDKGNKAQCLGCEKWDYYYNLTSEDGVCYYHPKCEKLDFL